MWYQSRFWTSSRTTSSSTEWGCPGWEDWHPCPLVAPWPERATRHASRFAVTTIHRRTARGSPMVSALRTNANQTVCTTSSAVAVSSRDARTVCQRIGVSSRTRSPICSGRRPGRRRTAGQPGWPSWSRLCRSFRFPGGVVHVLGLVVDCLVVAALPAAANLARGC